MNVEVGFDCVLATGRYLISPEVRHRGKDQALIDHRDNAAMFAVSGGKPVAGVDLPLDVQILRAEQRAATG